MKLQLMRWSTIGLIVALISVAPLFRTPGVIAQGKPGKMAQPVAEPLPGKPIGFSPDGKKLLTMSEEEARWHSVATGEFLGDALALGDDVHTAALSPDGKWLIVGHGTIPLGGAKGKGEARLWDLATGKAAGPPLKHADFVRAVGFSPDNKSFVTACDDLTIQLWDVAKRKPIGAPLRHADDPKDQVQNVAFSTDGKLLLSSSFATARLWNTSTGKPSGSMPHDGLWVRAAFSPSGKSVLTLASGLVPAGGPIPGVQLYSVSTGKPLGPVYSHFGLENGLLLAAALSPDSQYLVTCGDDKAARLWSVGAKKPLLAVLKHDDGVTAAAFSRDGKMLLTGSREGKSARLWNGTTGKAIGEALPHEEQVTAVGFCPDGQTFLTVAGGKTQLWRLGKQDK